MLNAASNTDFYNQVQTALITSQDDQLAHIVLFDRHFNQLCSLKDFDDQCCVDTSCRLDDITLSKFIKSSYFESYLKKRCKSDHPSESTFALRSLCRLYVIQGDHLHAGDALVKLATSNNNQIDIVERISLLDKALLNTRTCLTTKNSHYQQQEHINARIVDIENYLDVARIQSKVAECIETSVCSTRRSVDNDLRTIRSTGGLLDFTTLFQHYAEPYELYDCQLAIISMTSHPDHKLIQNLWLKICNKDLTNLRNGTFRTSYVSATLATLQGTTPTIDRSCDKNETKYIPTTLIVQTLEMIELTAPEREARRLPPIGWSISLLSKHLKLSSIIQQLQDMLTEPRGIPLIESIFDLVQDSDDIEAVTAFMRQLMQLLYAIDKADDREKVDIRIETASLQKLKSMHKALERRKQHILFR